MRYPLPSSTLFPYTTLFRSECLPLAEFAYNNSYQKSLQKAPFEALYGRRCITPLNWYEPEERVIFGPDVIQEAEERVWLVQDRKSTRLNSSHEWISYAVFCLNALPTT